MRYIKKILIVLLMVMALLGMTGCNNKTGQCAECGQTEKLYKYVYKNGDVEWLCEYCYNITKLFGT